MEEVFWFADLVDLSEPWVAAFSETVEIVEDFNEVEIVVEIYEDVVEDDDEDEVVEVEIGVAKIVAVQDDEDLFFSARESE